MGRQPAADRLQRHQRGLPLGVAEDARGQRAQADAAQPRGVRDVEDARVARGQQAPVMQGRLAPVLDDGPHRVDDVLGRQVVAAGEDGSAGGLPALAAGGVEGLRPGHVAGALGAQGRPGDGVDDVVDAAVPGGEAAEHPGVRGVEDGAGAQPGEVAAPEGHVAAQQAGHVVGDGQGRDLGGVDHAALGGLGLQEGVEVGGDVLGQGGRGAGSEEEVEHGAQLVGVGGDRRVDPVRGPLGVGAQEGIDEVAHQRVAARGTDGDRPSGSDSVADVGLQLHAGHHRISKRNVLPLGGRAG